MKKLRKFMEICLSLAMISSVCIPTYAVSNATMEKTTTADKEQKALRLNDVVSTDDYKENIFKDSWHI